MQDQELNGGICPSEPDLLLGKERLMIVENIKMHFDEIQYEILRRCSEKGDPAQWNEWRENNREAAIILKGADFRSANLKGADLCQADLQNADLRNADLEGADLWEANLQGADLCNTNLKGADLIRANLQSARLVMADLRKTDLWKANLKGAKIMAAMVNEQTFIWGCDFDEQTDFTGVGIDIARIEPRLKENLKANLRRMQAQDRWEQ